MHSVVDGIGVDICNANGADCKLAAEIYRQSIL